MYLIFYYFSSQGYCFKFQITQKRKQAIIPRTTPNEQIITVLLPSTASQQKSVSETLSMSLNTQQNKQYTHFSGIKTSRAQHNDIQIPKNNPTTNHKQQVVKPQPSSLGQSSRLLKPRRFLFAPRSRSLDPTNRIIYVRSVGIHSSLSKQHLGVGKVACVVLKVNFIQCKL